MLRAAGLVARRSFPSAAAGRSSHTLITTRAHAHSGQQALRFHRHTSCFARGTVKQWAAPPRTLLRSPQRLYGESAQRATNGEYRIFGLPWLTKKSIRWAVGVGTTLTAIAATAVYTIPPLYHAIHGSFRFTCCFLVGSWIAADYKWSLWGLSDEERAKEIKQVHQRSAELLLKLFRFNKGIFIKFGQHLCALEYILPWEYTQTMIPLQARAPTLPFHEIEKVILQEFGSKPDEIYTDFERVPIAAASLAQVHVATFRGEKVAVKVQFPALRDTCKGDIWTISVLVKIVAWLFPEFQFKWLVDEINANLPYELDFLHEARNCKKLASLFKDNKMIVTPPIHDSLTSSRVLTMKFMDGVFVNDLEGLKQLGISRRDVMTKVNLLFGDMIFRYGFVHCDPHPGNVLVRTMPGTRNTAQIVLLDHGLYKELPKDFRLDYCKLWKAIINMDEPELERIANKLHAPSYRMFASMLTARAWEQMSGGADKMTKAMTPEERQKIIDTAQERIGEILATLGAVQSELLLLFKTNDLLRSINRDLGHPINTITGCSRIVNDVLREQSLAEDSSLSNRLAVFCQSVTFKTKLWALGLYMWLRSCWTGNYDDF